MPGEYKYFAFISYSHADERWSRWLHRALETYRVPGHLVGRRMADSTVPVRLQPVFRDRDELTGAADLGSTITAALDASRHLIVICSPSAARSRWVDEEVRAFKCMGRGERILTLVVDGEPNASARPGEEPQECFAPSLRFDLDPDGGLSSRPAEPIAADLRPGKDGRTNAKLKLIAGMLGVGFDDLKQRELRRQQRRLLLVTAASLAGVLVTGTLAISAWFARQDAIRNRDRAEDLISFMLGDFRQQLEPLGKLELLKGVGDKAMAYFASQDQRDITNESLLRRAEALRQIGDVRLSLGEFEPALAAFQESLSLSRELSRRSPDNQDWLFALGNAWFWVGYTHWQKGDLDAAAAPMNEYFKAAERLVQLKPDDPRWQLELGYALANLGSLAAARGDGRAAIQYFESGNAIAEKLIQADPADVGLLLTRIENHSWLASIHQGLGELRKAKDLHAEALQLATELLASRPDDRRIQREEVLRQVFLSRVLLSLGELEEAGRVSSDALSAARAPALQRGGCNGRGRACGHEGSCGDRGRHGPGEPHPPATPVREGRMPARCGARGGGRSRAGAPAAVHAGPGRKKRQRGALRGRPGDGSSPRRPGHGGRRTHGPGPTTLDRRARDPLRRADRPCSPRRTRNAPAGPRACRGGEAAGGGTRETWLCGAEFHTADVHSGPVGLTVSSRS